MTTEIRMMSPSELIPYENNPRFNDAAVDQVAESIKAFGFRSPIIVDRKMVVIAGHTRLKAAEKLGLKEVPVIVASDMTDQQAKAYRLADNKTAEAAMWDFDMLDFELDGIADFDMADFGFRGESPVFNTEETESKRNTEELDISDYGEDRFTCVCPRCKFRFNPEGRK